MKHLRAPAFAALLVGLGAVSATPAHAVAVVSSQDFNWGTKLTSPVNGITSNWNGGIPTTVSGQFTIQNLDAFRSAILGGATEYPIANPTLIVDGMDTGPAFTDPSDPDNPPPYIQLEKSEVSGTIWDIWSIHFHNPWDWTWIRFGAFSSTREAVDALLTPDSLFNGMAMLMPNSPGSPQTQTFAVGVQTVPEPLTMLGAGMALGFGGFFKRELAKKQKKAGKKSE